MKRVAAIVALAILTAGCASATPRHADVVGSERGPIPPGYMPPPGECRIWRPDRPPDRQPPPGPCDLLKSYTLPPGAVLVEG